MERRGEVTERVGCSWQSEDRRTSVARRNFSESAAFHDAHGDDLSKCDASVCVCGKTDPHGGSWETTNRAGELVEPTEAKWIGYMTCTACGRVYDREGVAVRGPESLPA
jgi:hypothetical protein